jgi:signal peptidase I
MQPTLETGEHILVNKAAYTHINLQFFRHFIPALRAGSNDVVYLFHPPRQGDVIVFRPPTDDPRVFVKRVIAEPGDVVEIRDGKVIVNDKTLDEPYVMHPILWPYRAVTVEEDAYYVLGDNRSVSNDSRLYGPVPMENILGRAWLTYWPLGRFGTVHVSFGMKR